MLQAIKLSMGCSQLLSTFLLTPVYKATALLCFTIQSKSLPITIY
jgi:hypothetical protein